MTVTDHAVGTRQREQWVDTLRVVLIAGVIVVHTATGYVTDFVGYYYDDGLYYQEVYAEGEVAYQVIEPPIGAVVEELPAGCTDYVLEGVNYKNCGGIYYEPDGLSWKVVHL